MRGIFFIIIFLLLNALLFGQYVKTNNSIPLDILIKDTLIGNCVDVSNVTANNNAIGYGYFDNGGSSFPFKSGIVLNTGPIHIVEGPDDSPGLSGYLFPEVDADLQLISTGEIRECSIIEFDFIPKNDEISFTYIFGSEEFPDFVDSRFNDVFGFFLSGPGINGPFSRNAENIALLPNGDPVTINNVFYSQYYFGSKIKYQNYLRGLAYDNSIQFNGASAVLVATAKVVPNVTYHIKLAVADVGDYARDSGVFLEAGSFSSLSTNIINDTGVSELDCNVTSISLTATGGDSYLWSNNVNTSNNVVTEAGTYEVTISDTYGCSSKKSITITENYGFNSDIISNNGTVLDCNKTSIKLTASGGNSYLWDDGSSLPENVITQAGTYTVTVIGMNSCSNVRSINITQDIENPNLIIQNNSGTTELNCIVNNIELYAIGGGSYSWNNGGVSSGNVITQQGLYSVTATGNNGCTSSKDILITQDYSLPEINIISNNNGILDCNNDSINLVTDAEGIYLWSNNVDIAENIVSDPGIYTVTVTGNNGCTNSKSIVITEDYSIPKISIHADNDGVLDCNNNYVALTAAGGTGYLWNNSVNTGKNVVTDAGTYIVTVTGSNGCTGSKNILVTEDYEIPKVNIIPEDGYILNCDNDTLKFSVDTGISYLWSGGDTSGNSYNSFSEPGGYTVTVTGINGCTNSRSILITEDYEIPHIEIFNENGNILNCHNKYILFTVSGGVKYLWNGGDRPNSPVNGFSMAGAYTVTVTGDNGCSNSHDIEIVKTDDLIVDVSFTEILCNGGKSEIIINAGGGTPPYSGVGLFAGVSAGIHKYVVKDKDNCVIEKTINIKEPREIEVNPEIINHVTCYDFSDAKAIVNVKGGVPPYSYKWNIPESSTDRQVFNLPIGNWSVDVIDKNGCHMSGDFTIIQPEPLILEDTKIRNTMCYNSNDGGIAVKVKGGTKPYEYKLYNEVTKLDEPYLNNLTAGVYSIEIKDDNGCEIISEITIGSPPELKVEYSVDHPSCIEYNDGSITMNVLGGTPPYTYDIDGKLYYFEILGKLKQGVYDISIADANRCSVDIKNIILTDINENCLTIPSAFTPNGDGYNDKWIIEGIEKFPESLITVFNRWGQQVAEIKSYDEPWDGLHYYTNSYVPAGSYVYVITLYGTPKSYSGIVTIIY